MGSWSPSNKIHWREGVKFIYFRRTSYFILGGQDRQKKMGIECELLSFCSNLFQDYPDTISFHVCACVFHLHPSLYITWMVGAFEGQKKNIGSPETGTMGYELPCGCWESNPGPPEVQRYPLSLIHHWFSKWQLPCVHLQGDCHHRLPPCEGHHRRRWKEMPHPTQFQTLLQICFCIAFHKFYKLKRRLRG